MNRSLLLIQPGRIIIAQIHWASMSFFPLEGYARLNEKLAPDIAVLEGGYSVVNPTALILKAGIIMAMAGIDYSNLRDRIIWQIDSRKTSAVWNTFASWWMYS